MGKLIVTTGNYAKTGYLLKNSKQNIYSIEELCYCIMRNPELCDDYLYDDGLARYIRETLGLKERGALLADLIKRDAPLKDLIISQEKKLRSFCRNSLRWSAVKSGCAPRARQIVI